MNIMKKFNKMLFNNKTNNNNYTNHANNSNTKITNSRKLRYSLIMFMFTAIFCLISINYSLFVKTKAYEIYIKFDTYSFNRDVNLLNNNNNNNNDNKNNANVNLNENNKSKVVTDDNNKVNNQQLTNNNNNSKLFNNNEQIGDNKNLVLNGNTIPYDNVTHQTQIPQSTFNPLQMCPLVSPYIKGKRVVVDQTILEIDEIEHLFENKSIKLGGKWSPSECKPLYRVAIIVPYRNRENQLKLFLKHMHPFLMRQQLDYGIYLIEPTGNLTFNRGLLMNIGFTEAINDTNDYWDCYVFHDVDLLPEDDRNIYSCPPVPRHLSSAVSTFGYKLPYSTIFGGVTEFTKEQFQRVNGFSNYFFGWGGEDDDLINRVHHKGYKISRYPLEVGRYTMVLHKKEKPNEKRHHYLNSGIKRIDKDGINSLKYKVLKIDKFKLYTRVYITYNQTQIINSKK